MAYHNPLLPKGISLFCLSVLPLVPGFLSSRALSFRGSVLFLFSSKLSPYVQRVTQSEINNLGNSVPRRAHSRILYLSLSLLLSPPFICSLPCLQLACMCLMQRFDGLLWISFRLLCCRHSNALILTAPLQSKSGNKTQPCNAS